MFLKRSCKPYLLTQYSDSDLEEDIEITDEKISDGTFVNFLYKIDFTRIDIIQRLICAKSIYCA